MKLPDKSFSKAKSLQLLIDAYFKHIEGEFHEEEQMLKDKPTMVKVYTREPEPPTITGLALYLGFDSRQAFDEYEQSGKYASKLKRAALRIEAEYEKKLHQTAPAGAIFALKTLRWNEKVDRSTANPATGNLKIEIIETGPKIAVSEKDVVM